MRVWGLAIAAALVAGTALIGVPAAQAAKPVAVADADAPAAQPVVSGNEILDSRTGAVFVPHGANWPSFEYACIATSGRGWGYDQGDDTQAAADAMKSWHINTIRIPLNQDCWLGNNASHLYGTAAGYQAAVKQWVSILNGDGIVAILDLHWSAPAGKIAVDQYPMADAQSLTFWSQVAAAYKSNPSVIFDAFNEPYSRYDGDTLTFDLTWDCWKNGGCLAPDVDQNSALDGGTYKVVGMSAIVAAIRAAGAAQPVMLGGLDYSNDLTGWLAHKPDDSQLIASWHNYPGQGCDTVSCWNSQVAPVAATVPVITGEFGETDGGSSFMTTFMTWADAHGIGYLPWAWWEVSKSESVDNNLYSLVTGPDFEPQAPAGTAYYDHLLALAGTTSVLPLVNPGFESGTTGWTDHSNLLTLSKGAHPAWAHGGTGYLVAIAKKAGRGFEQSVPEDVQAGDVYTATIWLRTQTASSEKIQVTLNADGGSTERTAKTFTIGKTWKQYTFALTVADAGHTAVRLSTYLESANRGIYADDAAVTLTR